MSNKFKSGLFVGKFVAYHKGHQACINHFASLCEKLKVVICTKPSDRIPGDIRRKWLEQDLKFNVNKDIKLHENIELYHLVEDNIPLYPEGLLPWCNAITDLVGNNIDVMFGNEEYVLDCAKLFKSEYYIPDMNRSNINISSTKILDTGLKNYSLISKVAQPYFNKVVLVSGAYSTGKSQMCSKLSKDYQGFYIEEFGRSFFENEIMKSGMNGLSNWTIKEYENACIYHNDLMEKAIAKPIKILFADLDAMTINAFNNLYLGEHSNTIKKLITSQKQIINERIFLSNQGISEESMKMKEYYNESKSKRKELVDPTLLNLYLKHSFNFNHVNFKEFNLLSNKSTYVTREENIKEYLDQRFLI